MSIIDEVLANVKSAADVFGRKANQVVDISKLRYNVSSLNTEIGKRYAELGQYVYDGTKNSNVDNTVLASKIEEIDDLYNQLSDIAKQIAELQNKAICPECGKEVAIGSVYCSFCGAKLPEIKVEEPVCEADESETESQESTEAEENAEVEIEDIPVE
ncbi:MAG: zinc ribbon domain-containing protein [Clostridia bacterium]|nr:zinc ribbon domain-containing protein [Clostridia bacterium]